MFNLLAFIFPFILPLFFHKFQRSYTLFLLILSFSRPLLPVLLFAASHLKNLGVFFGRHMSFDIHITEISRKVSGILMYINRIQDSLSKEARLIAVQIPVLSHLNYTITVWSTASTTQLKRVQKLQNSTARVARGGVSKFDHETPLLQKLQWLPMKKKYILQQCALKYKVIKKQLPNWILS